MEKKIKVNKDKKGKLINKCPYRTKMNIKTNNKKQDKNNDKLYANEKSLNNYNLKTIQVIRYMI